MSEAAKKYEPMLAGELKKTKDMMGFDQSSQQKLQTIAKDLQAVMPQVLTEAHHAASRLPEFSGMLMTPEMKEAAQKEHVSYWNQVIDGTLGQEYLDFTLAGFNRQGVVGSKYRTLGIGLCIGGFVSEVIKSTLGNRGGFFKKSGRDVEEVADALEAFVQSAFLSIGSQLDLYAAVGEEAKAAVIAKEREQQDAVRTQFGAAMSAIANRDLRHRMSEDLPEEFRMLATDFNNATEQLASIIANIDEATANILSGAGEISSATDNLSTRTEQQAASIEETAAALEQITTTVNEAAGRAADAGKLVSTTKDNAVHSGEVVRNAINAMSEISESSSAISNIIGVIDEIAFQTNLLALNAGVEAARAGEAGKGFAVVAQEVRELAQRSANAAKEIKDLITKSSDQVKNGVNLVDETGKALETIVAQVQEINTNIVAIVDGSREQAIGLKEVNTAVNQMDQGTQQNAAMVEETTAASRVLKEEIDRVAAMLQQFKTGKRGDTRVAVSAPAQRVASSPAPAAAPVSRSPVKAVTAETPAPRSTRPPAPARQQAAIAQAFNASTTNSSDGWEEF